MPTHKEYARAIDRILSAAQSNDPKELKDALLAAALLRKGKKRGRKKGNKSRRNGK